MTTPLGPERWPQLTFTEAGLLQLFAVYSFVLSLIDTRPDLAVMVRDDLIERLDYLNEYGGTISELDPRRRFRVYLGRDMAPLSFSLVWESLEPQTNEYRYAFNGGLIYHGGQTPSPTSSLWGVHT